MCADERETASDKAAAQGQGQVPGKAAAKDTEKKGRLALALRENLKRRKAQISARRTDSKKSGDGSQGE
jgi:hypothetical protein